MKIGYPEVIIGFVILLFVILFFVIWIRREKSKRIIQKMPKQQKVQKLNELAEPFGFFYKEEADLFTTKRDAWQRDMGYERLYDHAAVATHMIIDSWPVYFDYDGKTWLIELWKGQYGINTGGEVGIYHAKTVVPPALYAVTHFEAVEEEEMPWIRSVLIGGNQVLYENEARHWWLTGFRMGMFFKPEKLQLYTNIVFENREQAEAFYFGLQKSGNRKGMYDIYKERVCIRMNMTKQVVGVTRVLRSLLLFSNRFWTAVYRKVTAPFQTTEDRMLFLYYQIPWCFRKMLQLEEKRYGRRKKRQNCKCRKHHGLS